MVRRNVYSLTLAVVALLGARPASAAPVSFTGRVDQDFPATDKSVFTIVDNAFPDGVTSNPNDVNLPNSGWNMQYLRLRYDKASDTMAVGIKFFGIAGDADGNGDPGNAATNGGIFLPGQPTGGVDLPHLGGRESITVGFDTDNNKKLDVVAGVPADKKMAGPGLNGFNVARFKELGGGIQFGYGDTLTDHLGALAFDPSAEHPDFQFTIRNFSTLPGLDLSKGFSIRAYAGTPDDVVAGEDMIPLTFVKGLTQEPQLPSVPEPATVLAWTLVAGGAAWRARRRRRVA